MNPHYPAYVAEYLETLKAYSPPVLRAAMDTVMHDWPTTQTWPTPGYIAKKCLAEDVARRPLEKPAPPQLPRPRLSDEQRQLMCERMRRLIHVQDHGHADGSAYAKDYTKDHAWVYDGVAAQREAAP